MSGRDLCAVGEIANYCRVKYPSVGFVLILNDKASRDFIRTDLSDSNSFRSVFVFTKKQYPLYLNFIGIRSVSFNKPRVEKDI